MRFRGCIPLFEREPVLALFTSSCGGPVQKCFSGPSGPPAGEAGKPVVVPPFLVPNGRGKKRMKKRVQLSGWGRAGLAKTESSFGSGFRVRIQTPKQLDSDPGKNRALVTGIKKTGPERLGTVS